MFSFIIFLGLRTGLVGCHLCLGTGWILQSCPYSRQAAPGRDTEIRPPTLCTLFQNLPPESSVLSAPFSQDTTHQKNLTSPAPPFPKGVPWGHPGSALASV